MMTGSVRTMMRTEAEALGYRLWRSYNWMPGTGCYVMSFSNPRDSYSNLPYEKQRVAIVEPSDFAVFGMIDFVVNQPKER